MNLWRNFHPTVNGDSIKLICLRCEFLQSIKELFGGVMFIFPLVEVESWGGSHLVKFQLSQALFHLKNNCWKCKKALSLVLVFWDKSANICDASMPENMRLFSISWVNSGAFLWLKMGPKTSNALWKLVVLKCGIMATSLLVVP